jgi:sulfoxide reductase heme-binding subunit YedZ
MSDPVVTVIVRYSGIVAIALLFATLATTPLGRLFARARPEHARSYPRLRRKLGIVTASLALVHAALAFGGWMRGPLTLLLEWPFLRAGFAALLVLSLLLLTSFPPVVRALHLSTWKELHRLAYVAAFFALQHLALAPFGRHALLVALLGLGALLVALRWLPRPKGDMTR